ncbi:MAG: BolA/IbaG family iron-sulfur metabolism protein [Pseudomonadales bacterium]
MEFDHLQIVDESSNHSVPEGAQSHFKLVLVAGRFDGMSRIARHRLINDLVADEFSGGLHALAIHAYTHAEWQAMFGEAPMSPACAKA